MAERESFWRVDLVKRETCRAHIRVAFGENIELHSDDLDDWALVRGRVGQRVNLQFAQYFAKFIIAGQLRVRRGARGGIGGECDGRNCGDEGACVSTRLFEVLAIKTKNSELDSAYTEGRAAQPCLSGSDARGLTATFDFLHSAVWARTRMNAAIQSSMTTLHAAHAVRGAGAGRQASRCAAHDKWNTRDFAAALAQSRRT